MTIKPLPSRRYQFLGFLFLLALYASGSAQAFMSGQLPDFTLLAEENAEAVVYVEITETRKNGSGGAHDQVPDIFRRFFDLPENTPGEEHTVQSSGSGFVIGSKGYILTNHHVVEDAEQIMVRFKDRSEYKAEVIGTDPATDIALLKVEANNLKTVRLGQSSRLKQGEWVLAIGSPFNFEHTVTSGIVSAKGRSFPRQPYVPFIQTDVPINRGNSGGPLINMQGEVVGINSQIFSSNGGYMGLSFAIPIDVAMAVVKQLQETGEMKRGYLGVGYQEVTRELAENLGLDKPQGALVNHIEPGSAAEKAGLKIRDVILNFDQKDLIFAADLPPLVGMKQPGEKAPIVFIRDGKKQRLMVTIGEIDQDNEQIGSRLPEPARRSTELMGMELADLDEDIRTETGIERGVLVREVNGRKARRAGIREGDILTMLDNVEIENLKTLKSNLENRPENAPAAFLIWRDGFTRFVVIR